MYISGTKLIFYVCKQILCLQKPSLYMYITARVYPSCDHTVQAFKEERFYPGYVWITPGWYQQGWWKADEVYLRSLNCTISDIEQQLNRSLVLLAHPNMVRNALGQVCGTRKIMMKFLPTQLQLSQWLWESILIIVGVIGSTMNNSCSLHCDDDIMVGCTIHVTWCCVWSYFLRAL